MEVGCSRIWGLVPTTQPLVGGTPHKPALLATSPARHPRPPKQAPVTLNHKFSGKTIPNRESREGKYVKARERQHTKHWAKQNHEDMRRRTHNGQNEPLTTRTARRRHREAQHANNTRTR